MTDSSGRPERSERPQDDWATREWTSQGYYPPPTSYGPLGPYDRPGGGTAVLDPPTREPGTTAGPRRPRRTMFAASVLASSLVVGGGAGLAGAAIWDSTHSDSATGASGAPLSQVGGDSAPAPAHSVEGVSQAVLPSVVKIYVTGPQESGSGSGIVLSSDGNILTNNHVVAVAGQSGQITVSFNNGSTAKATIVGTDPLTDTAVIKAQGVTNLHPATIGKSSSLRVGESVVAIGSPYGLDGTVTSGIVSALNRPVDVGSDGQGNATVYPAVQTDAAINPGNSGGPLVDLQGHVVGINASIQTSPAQSQSGAEPGSIGLGFAIPIDEVMPVINQMLKGETPTHARMGVSVQDRTSGNGSQITQGAQVQQVTPGSSAAKAGLKPGDVIVKVNDQQIANSDALVATVRSYRPGDKVTVTYTRGGTPRTVTLVLDSDASTTNS